MASKQKKHDPRTPLLNIQAGMEALAAQSVLHTVGIRNIIKVQPLCSEGIETLEQIEKAANGLLKLAQAYRKELATLASEGRGHAA